MGAKPHPDEIGALMEPVYGSLAELALVIPPDNRPAWDILVNYIAVTERIIQTTNPSKIREAARNVWIQGLIQPGEKKDD